MKYLVFLILLFSITNCNAQTIFLEAAAQCSTNPNCPDYTYEKDINNSLTKYIGIWQGTYNGKLYELKFNKSLYQDFTGFKRDEITGRLRITTTGNLPLTIFDNFNEPTDENTNFGGLGFSSNLQSYEMVFSGPSTTGCKNFGSVFLRINQASPNQMTILYWSDTGFVVGDCPGSFTQTLPEKQEIILTKQ